MRGLRRPENMLALHDQRGQILNHASTADARPDLRVSREESSTWRGVRALVGLSLGALTLTPVYRLLDDPGTGPFGEGTVRIAASNLSATWLGIAVTLGLGTVLAILVPRERLIRALAPLKRGATEVPLGWWVLGLSSISTALALWASLGLFQGLPTLVDGMTSVMHARFMAAGQAAGALPDPAAAWMIPNSVLTEGGWVSQYPPMHSLLLSLGLRAGVPWLVNPLLTGVLTACATLVAHHLLGRNAPPARLGSLFIACSPFVVFLGGGYLSHVSAAAFAAFTLYAALRARDGAWLWSVAAGAGMGALVTSRPWTGMVLGTAFTLGLWLAAAIRDPTRHLGRLPRRLAGATLGGAPFAIAWGVYNSRFFGHPLRMGYSAAYGPSHDLGFHVDPWGNVYGPTEGLGYIAANLLALGFHALETFLPIVPLVAAYLVLARVTPRGVGVLLAWAVLPLAANFFYWHHGFHLGPRMLYEAAPAWLLLAALGMVALAEGGGGGGGQAVTAGPSGRRVPTLRDVALWGVIAAIPSIAFFAPRRATSYQWTPETLQRIAAPEPAGSNPALVFVHGSWSERIAARLQAEGMGLDSIETALRRNDTCRLHRWSAFRLGTAPQGAEPPELDFRPLLGMPSTLVPMTITEGNRVHMDPGATWPPECRREVAADRTGVISLAPLSWQGDLPGIEQGRPMFVRDLGPEQNRRLMEHYPDRAPVMFLALPGDGTPGLMPYERAEALLWSEGAAGP